MLDILILNANVISGTGEPSFEADIGIKDKKITLISKDTAVESVQIIQADGLYLAPGFIDPHMHSDLTLFGNQRAESSIHQGVTTEIIGNCGMSAAPLSEESLGEIEFLTGGLKIDFRWRGMGDYLEQLRKSGMAVNVVPLVGHSNVRAAVMGLGNNTPTPDLQKQMEFLLAEAMEQGGRGMSTGLFYPPGYYAKTEEVIGLAKVVARYGGIYASHIRNESDEVLSAAEEAIEIGLSAELPVQYSHVKISGHLYWDKINELMKILDSDKAKDVNLGCDQYPYHASSTTLSSILPYWAQVGGGKTVAELVSDTDGRKRLRKDWDENQDQCSRSGVKDWSGIQIAECQSRPEVIGMSIEEIASQDNLDPFDAAMDLIALDDAQVVVVYFDQNEEIVQRLMQHTRVVIGSDSLGAAPYGILGQSGAHPRTYGTFPRVLSRYVREEKVLSLEEAIKKMTSQTAQQFSLEGRGVIREGAWADLVIFDANQVKDQATFSKPHQFPLGIQYVIVNGDIVITEGVHTGRLPGIVL
ncbi:MAG: D-aminoacylase [Deltaproteobacteria bacterium]|nr:D-aminoacylase [Deltaproteobacteria bacterium]